MKLVKKQILMVLTMVYHIRNYSVFGLFPLSGILGTRKHDVSETSCVNLT
jgi:hypothetical protein